MSYSTFIAHSMIDCVRFVYIKLFQVWYETFVRAVVIYPTMYFFFVFLFFSSLNSEDLKKSNNHRKIRGKKERTCGKNITIENRNGIKYFTCVNVDGFSHTIFSPCVCFSLSLFNWIEFLLCFFFCLFVCCFVLVCWFMTFKIYSQSLTLWILHFAQHYTS